MSTPNDLPQYSAAELAALDLPELIDLMIADEDRVPMNVIEACARRGEAMVDDLGKLLEEDDGELDSLGQWWLKLHAIMILGLIASEEAGLLLVQFMRRMSDEEDYNLQDWLSGYWPALFKNKPGSALKALRELSEDGATYWYMRSNAIEASIALPQGMEALEDALDWAASIAADETEGIDVRLSAGNTLLDFPRIRHRALLEDLVELQAGDLSLYFSMDDLEDAYAGMQDTPHWTRFENPWKFYEPETIRSRQERWEKEASEPDWKDDFDFEDDFSAAEPYVRTEPKIGRNDPCPCGSGKKYKKCCMPK